MPYARQEGLAPILYSRFEGSQACAYARVPYLRLMIKGTPVVKNRLVYVSQVSTWALLTHFSRLSNDFIVCPPLPFLSWGGLVSLSFWCYMAEILR